MVSRHFTSSGRADFAAASIPMTNLLFLVPIALFLGALGLVAFLWCVRSGQFDDLDGAAERILIDEDTVEKRETSEKINAH